MATTLGGGGRSRDRDRLAGQGTQSDAVAAGRSPEQAPVLPAELRGTLVSDGVRDLRYIALARKKRNVSCAQTPPS